MNGETQIVADEAFCNAVRSYYEVSCMLCFLYCLKNVHRISFNAYIRKGILSFKSCELTHLLQTVSSYSSFAALEVEIHCLGTRDKLDWKISTQFEEGGKKRQNEKPLVLKIFLAVFDTTRHCYLYLHMSKLPLLTSASVVSYHLEKCIF